MCVCVCMGVTPPDQTKNDRDLKFGSHPPVDHIYFFKKSYPKGQNRMAIILKFSVLYIADSLLCHVDQGNLSQVLTK